MVGSDIASGVFIVIFALALRLVALFLLMLMLFLFLLALLLPLSYSCFMLLALSSLFLNSFRWDYKTRCLLGITPLSEDRPYLIMKIRRQLTLLWIMAQIRSQLLYSGYCFFPRQMSLIRRFFGFHNIPLFQK